MTYLKLKRILDIAKKSPVEMAVLVLMSLVLVYGVTPALAKADERVGVLAEADLATQMQIAAMQNTLKEYGAFPVADLRGPSYTLTVTATAYNSVPEQTDSTPFITASGTHVRHGVIAANFLPIGTRIKIPDIYGDQVFVVEDRMNPRYHKRIDIWMESIPEARQFGLKNVTIEVYR